MNCWSMPYESKLASWEQHCFHASQGKPGCPKRQAEILFPSRTPAQMPLLLGAIVETTCLAVPSVLADRAI